MRINKNFILLPLFLFGLLTSAGAQKAKKKKPQPKAVVSQEDLNAKRLADKLPYTEKILVFDSTVVSKHTDIPLPRHLGSVTTYAKVFGKQAPDTWRAYVNEFNDYCVFSKPDSTGHMQLFTTYLVGKQWTAPHRIKDFDGLFTDITCPYVSEDGTSLFFAAKGDDGLGGLDIYRSSYDTENKRYMEPQSLGLPFNSTANDYYCVTSETDSLTWLVTDRRQPEGKQCVYYCVTRQPRVDYNADNLTQKQLLALAEIHSIKDSWGLWKDKGERQRAAQRLDKACRQDIAEGQSTGRFFVNDRVEYSSAEQFKSSASRDLYRQWTQMRADASQRRRQLDAMREQYEQASAATKKSMAPEMLKAERQIEQLDATIAQTEKRLRNNENQSLK